MKYIWKRARRSGRPHQIDVTDSFQRLKRICGLIGLCAALSLGGAASATAGTLNYDFSATASGGALAGDVFSGTFSVASADVASGSGNLSNFSIDILGTIVTQSEGVFGLVPSATFAANGSLTSLSNFVAISTARANADGLSGGIFLPSPMTSFNFDGGLNYGTDPNQGEIYGPGAVVGNVVGTTPVPEPTSLALLGTGLAILGLFGLRKRRSLSSALGSFSVATSHGERL